MAQEINELHAAHFWEMVGVSVSGCNVRPKQHKGDVKFVGYFNLQVWLFSPDGEAMPFLDLQGNSLKLIGENVHFDPKSEPAKDNRPGGRKFFNHWFPMARAAREVLTRKLVELPEIQEMVQQAVTQLTGENRAQGA